MKNYNADIARFMGWAEIPPKKRFWGIFTNRNEIIFVLEKDGIVFRIKETNLKFDTDWGWLMESVQKLVEIGAIFKMEWGEKNHVRISFGGIDIVSQDNNSYDSGFETIYNVVGQFAEEYNKTKKDV